VGGEQMKTKKKSGVWGKPTKEKRHSILQRMLDQGIDWQINGDELYALLYDDESSGTFVICKIEHEEFWEDTK
jgi:hypothetical protein